MKCQHKDRTRCTLKGWEGLIAERLEEEARMCPDSGLCLSLPCTCHSFKAASARSCIQIQKQPDSCPCLTPLDSFLSRRPGCRLCGKFLWRLLHDLHLLTWNFNLRLHFVFPAGPNFISFITAVMVDLWLRCFQHQVQRSPSGHEHERHYQCGLLPSVSLLTLVDFNPSCVATSR